MKIFYQSLILISIISCSHFSSKDRKYSSEDLKISKPANEIKILIVQDEPSTIMTMTALLNKSFFKGANFQIAKSYENAIRLFKNNSEKGWKFDFAVLDNTLIGKETGIDVAKEIVRLVNENEDYHLPIMTMFTASPGDHDRNDLQKIKVLNSINSTKPLELIEFLLEFVNPIVFKKKEDIKILVVDKNEGDADLFVEGLAEYGGFTEENITFVSSLEQGYKVYESSDKNPFDIIVFGSEISSGSETKSGLELANKIHIHMKNKRRAFPIKVLCTSNPSEYQKEVGGSGIAAVCPRGMEGLSNVLHQFIIEPKKK